ncbi:MAG: fumarylacetoacetate hydrolase family protein [Gaiellaceae bacterium]
MSRLCMFHPLDHPLERGWVGRVDGDRVIQLAAQTLQSYFTGGGTAREHAEFPLAEVRLLAPVLHPPSVRVFENESTFAFANSAAIVGPGAEVTSGNGAPSNSLLQGRLSVLARLAGVIGAGGALAGYTVLADWRDPSRAAPKDRDFALGLGPVVLTPDALDLGELEVVMRVDGHERAREPCSAFDWQSARELAADRTMLYPGDLLAGPPVAVAEGNTSGQLVELEVDPIGVLAARVGRQT